MFNKTLDINLLIDFFIRKFKIIKGLNKNE